MLNVIILVAVLVGGSLSTLGGFLANYYIQATAEKISKRKEIRDILEKVYKSTQTINFTYIRLKLSTSDTTSKVGDLQEIDFSIDSIEFLVDFYLPPLKQAFSDYRKEVYDILGSGHSIKELTTATEKFRSALIQLFQAEGYSYFTPRPLKEAAKKK